jgi:hypothetical protein
VSGATTITRTGARWALTLTTPRVSFPAPSDDLPPDGLTDELRYHREAEERLGALMARLVPGMDGLVALLDRQLAGRAVLIARSEALTLLSPRDDAGIAAFLAEGDRPCRMSFFLNTSWLGDAEPVGLGELGDLELAFQSVPDAATQGELHRAACEQLQALAAE